MYASLFSGYHQNSAFAGDPNSQKSSRDSVDQSSLLTAFQNIVAGNCCDGRKRGPAIIDPGSWNRSSCNRYSLCRCWNTSRAGWVNSYVLASPMSVLHPKIHFEFLESGEEHWHDEECQEFDRHTANDRPGHGFGDV